MTSDMQGPRTPQFRPMDIGELIDQSFRLFLRNWKPLLIIGGISAVPSILTAGFTNMLQGSLKSPTNNQLFLFMSSMEEGDFSRVLSLVVMLLVAALGLFLLTPLLQGAVIAVCSRTYLGQPTTAGQALRIGLRRYFPLLGTMLLSGLMFLVAIPVLAIAGLLVLAPITIIAGLVALSVYTAFNNLAVVVEGAGGGAPAIARSFRLVTGRFWPLLGLGVIFYLIDMMTRQTVTFAVNQFFALVLASATSGTVFTVGWISSIFLGAVAAVTTPFHMVGLTLAYYDTRMRKEGFDLEMLAHSQVAAPVDEA